MSDHAKEAAEKIRLAELAHPLYDAEVSLSDTITGLIQQAIDAETGDLRGIIDKAATMLEELECPTGWYDAVQEIRKAAKKGQGDERGQVSEVRNGKG